MLAVGAGTHLGKVALEADKVDAGHVAAGVVGGEEEGEGAEGGKLGGPDGILDGIARGDELDGLRGLLAGDVVKVEGRVGERCRASV